MTLPYDRQYTLAVVQKDFLARTSAGSFAAALAQFGANPNVDPIKQKQRMALVNALIDDATYKVNTFAWVVVSRPAVNTDADLTDTFIATTITNQFDNIASQLFINITS